MKKKTIRKKAWAIVDSDDRSAFCEAHPIQVMCKHRAAQYEWKVRVVPCTISYEVAAAKSVTPARKRRT